MDVDVDEGIEEYLLGHELWERHPGPPAAAWAALHVHRERLRERLGVDEVELERVITAALEARRAQRIAAGREGQCSK
jgi:hypothetical protein